MRLQEEIKLALDSIDSKRGKNTLIKRLPYAKCLHIYVLLHHQTHTKENSMGGIFISVFQVCKPRLREPGWLIPGAVGLEPGLAGCG